jgi:hypothetical protein
VAEEPIASVPCARVSGIYYAGAYFGVALTQRGNIAVNVRHVNDGFAPLLHTYYSFEEAEGEGMPGDILATAASEISDGTYRGLISKEGY